MSLCYGMSAVDSGLNFRYILYVDSYYPLNVYQMCQTPLHIAAANNNVEIMRCLFEWRGPEDIELEAKNTVLDEKIYV